MKSSTKKISAAFLMFLFFTVLYLFSPEKEIICMIADGIEMDFVRIPPGQFVMGALSSDLGKNALPVHPVKISQSFYLGRYEVTQSQWSSIMKENPSCFYHPDFPVESFTSYECSIFLEKLNSSGKGFFRLPSEAEWEYACRAGTSGNYFWAGDTSEIVRYANFGDISCGKGTVYRRFAMERLADKKMNDGFEALSPAGSFGSNPWGLYDMLGNVWETCSDWYSEDYYRNSPVLDPRGPLTGEVQVLRGGSWGDSPHSCTCSVRGTPNDSRWWVQGLRLVYQPDDPVSRMRRYMERIFNWN